MVRSAVRIHAPDYNAPDAGFKASPALFVDAAKVDDRDPMLGGDQFPVDTREHFDDLVVGTELWVLSLDVAGREVGNLLDLDPVQDRGIHLLSASESGSHGYPGDHSRLVFIRLIAKTDGDSLTIVAEHISIQVGIKVERKHRKPIIGYNEHLMLVVGTEDIG